MLNKRILREIELFRLTLRKIGPLYFVPIFFLYFLIPLLGVGYFLYHGDGDKAKALIFFDFQKIIPFMGCWWILFGLSDYVDERTRELLQLYKKNSIGLFWLIHGWYLLHVVALFLICNIFFENYWTDFPVIVIQTFTFSSVAYFLLFFTRTLMVPFLVVLIYEIFAFLSNFGFLQWMNIFCLTRISDFHEILIPYGFVFVGAIIVNILGEVFYRKNSQMVS